MAVIEQRDRIEVFQHSQNSELVVIKQIDSDGEDNFIVIPRKDAQELSRVIMEVALGDAQVNEASPIIERVKRQPRGLL